MAVTISYPGNLPDFRLGKQRKQVQTYRTSEPFNGPLFIEKITDESPVTWRITVTCTSAIQARIFQAFLRKVNNGETFIKDILTEEGHIAHEVRFIEMPLEPDQSSGSTVWSYTGLIQAIKLIQPDAAIDDDLIILYLDQSNVIDIAVNIDWSKFTALPSPSRLSSPLVHLFTNDKTVEKLTNGTLTTDRATIGTFIDKSDGLLKTAAIDTIREEAEGFLIEGASTNPLLRSEEFDNASWFKNGSASITGVNVETSPDGSVTADELNSSSSNHIRQSITVVDTGQSITYSIFVKKGTADTVRLRFIATGGTTQDLSDVFAFSSESFTSATNDSNNVLKLINGWFRLSITTALSGSQTSSDFRISSNDASLTKFFIWGGQGEDGLPIASSYIKTTTTAATRAGDGINFPFAGNHPDLTGLTSEFSYLVTVSPFGKFEAQSVMAPLGGTFTFSLLRLELNGSYKYFRDGAGITDGVDKSSATTKLAVTVKPNDTKLYADGAEIASGSQIPTVNTGNPTTFNIGSGQASSTFFGHFNDVMIYDFEATPTEIAQIQG